MNYRILILCILAATTTIDNIAMDKKVAIKHTPTDSLSDKCIKCRRTIPRYYRVYEPTEVGPQTLCFTCALLRLFPTPSARL
jgi:hypothetical protein